MPIRKPLLAGGAESSSPRAASPPSRMQFLDQPILAGGLLPTASARTMSANRRRPTGLRRPKDAVTYSWPTRRGPDRLGLRRLQGRPDRHQRPRGRRRRAGPGRIGTSDSAQPATVVGGDPSRDLALRTVGAATCATRSRATPASVSVGDPTCASASRSDSATRSRRGIVSALQRSLQAPDGAKISGASRPTPRSTRATSGGPLIDADGKVVGVDSRSRRARPRRRGRQRRASGSPSPANTVKSLHPPRPRPASSSRRSSDAAAASDAVGPGPRAQAPGSGPGPAATVAARRAWACGSGRTSGRDLPRQQDRPATAAASASAVARPCSAHDARLVARVAHRVEHVVGVLAPARLEHELHRRLAHVQVDALAQVLDVDEVGARPRPRSDSSRASEPGRSGTRVKTTSRRPASRLVAAGDRRPAGRRRRCRR